MNSNNRQVRVSLVAADPFRSANDILEEEAEAIQNVFNTNNRPLEISVIVAETEKQLSTDLRKHSPHIVEFTGHGMPRASIFVTRCLWMGPAQDKSFDRQNPSAV